MAIDIFEVKKMTVAFKIKCRLPWFKYAKREIELSGNTFEEINQECLRYDMEFCPDVVFNAGKDKFRANNLGEVEIEYAESLSQDKIKNHINTLISFISMCVGDICQCEDWTIIDNRTYEKFFDFPSETPTELPLSQKRKFWEVSFEEIRNDFGSILDFLLHSPKSKIITTYILPNYLATVYFIDFIGSLEWKFKNAVTTIESLMYYIKHDEYTEKEKGNKDKFKSLKTKIKQEEGIESDLKYIDSYSSPKRISLDKKIQDAILLGQEYLGVEIKKDIDINLYSKKCANTRNLLSHYIEENPHNQYLAENEISDATHFLIRKIFQRRLQHRRFSKRLLQTHFPNQVRRTQSLYPSG